MGMFIVRLSTFSLFIGLFIQIEAIELKTYYQYGGYPKYFKTIDKKKPYGGLCIEIMELIEKKSNNQIKFSAPERLVKFKRIKKDLEDGKIDVYLGLAKKNGREKIYNYINFPLYKVNFVLAARKDDNINIKSFNDIRDLGEEGIILMNPGTSSENFLKRQGGLKIDSGATNLSINLLKLVIKRGRFVYSHDLGLISTIKKEGLTEHIKIVPTTFTSHYHYMAFSKKIPVEVVEKIEKILYESSNNGELENILDKYFKF